MSQLGLNGPGTWGCKNVRECLKDFLQMCEKYNPPLALGIMSLTTYQNTLRTSAVFSQQSSLIKL